MARYQNPKVDGETYVVTDTRGMTRNLLRPYNCIEVQLVNFVSWCATGQELKGSRFINCKFVGCSFISVDFSRCEFVGCEFIGTIFVTSNLNEAVFDSCEMTSIAVTSCSFRGSMFQRGSISEINWSDVDLSRAMLGAVSIANCAFNRCTLEETVLEQCDIFGLDLHDSNLRFAKLVCVDGTGGNILLKNVTAVGLSIELSNLYFCTLENVDLDCALLVAVNLMDSTIRESSAHLSHFVSLFMLRCTIESTRIDSCTARNAHFVEVDFGDSTFVGAQFTNCAFSLCDLSRVSGTDNLVNTLVPSIPSRGWSEIVSNGVFSAPLEEAASE